jgi:hypothetical protein
MESYLLARHPGAGLLLQILLAVIFEGLPKRTEFGQDCNSFTCCHKHVERVSTFSERAEEKLRKENSI